MSAKYFRSLKQELDGKPALKTFFATLGIGAVFLGTNHVVESVIHTTVSDVKYFLDAGAMASIGMLFRNQQDRKERSKALKDKEL